MIKCPFCNFDNEEGALFCEQCKSDLSNVPVTAAVAVVEAAVIEDDIIPIVPMEAFPVEALPLEEIEPLEAVEAIVEAEPAPAPPPPPPAPAVAALAAAPPPVPPAPAPAAAAPPASPATAAFFGPDAKPVLKVIRGLKIGTEYPVYEGNNFIGRADDQPVDIDLEPQEPPDRVWTSRQHALVVFDKGVLTLEDLNSSNGTFLNRARVHPGQPQPLKPNDVVQIGTVQLKVTG